MSPVYVLFGSSGFHLRGYPARPENVLCPPETPEDLVATKHLTSAASLPLQARYANIVSDQTVIKAVCWSVAVNISLFFLCLGSSQAFAVDPS